VCEKRFPILHFPLPLSKDAASVSVVVLRFHVLVVLPIDAHAAYELYMHFAFNISCLFFALVSTLSNMFANKQQANNFDIF